VKEGIMGENVFLYLSHKANCLSWEIKFLVIIPKIVAVGLSQAFDDDGIVLPARGTDRRIPDEFSASLEVNRFTLTPPISN
jgi:hypothetical protein